ncbi:U3 small nucleolar RNA-associated protein 11 [Entamoeba marina]
MNPLFINETLFNQTTHRSRSQPLEQRHLGKLERKEDFKKRAKKYKLQKKTTLYLQRQAAMKNPDEFNTKMTSLRLQGKHLISTKPQEKESIQEVEMLLRVQKNALHRLQKKDIITNSERIVYDENGVPHKALPADLLNAASIKEKIEVNEILKARKQRQQKVIDIQKQIKKTQQRLQELVKAERQQDKRKKIEIKDEYGDVVATHYQTLRKK